MRILIVKCIFLTIVSAASGKNCSRCKILQGKLLGTLAELKHLLLDKLVLKKQPGTDT